MLSGNFRSNSCVTPAEREVGLLLELLVSEVRMVTHPLNTSVRTPLPSTSRISKQGRQRDEGRVPEKPQQVVAPSSRRFRG